TIKEPDQYEEKIETILTNYVSDSLSDATYTTDIIVIMNETYSDLRMYDSSESIPQTPSISFTENVYSFLDEISANSLSGTVQVPVYGGTTANSEFEFLMGTSLIFRADTPYQTVFNDLDEDTLQNGSLVTVMEMLGYETGALHPSQPSAWNREVVYSKMGFDSAYFLEDLTYSEEDLDRDWIMRDACDYDNVLKILEENTSDSPSFIFNVTIQNHGGYSTAPDTSAIVQIEGQEGSFSDAENYLSLIYDSDLATADFLAALEARERPSIVVFFGDHGPGLKNDFYQWATGEEFDLSDSLHYQTPFFIWSSQGNLEGDLDHVSLNYLSTILFNSLDLPQTGYQKFLNDLYTQYPVVNNHLLMNTAGNELDYEETLENSQLLQLYEAIAYNQLEENGAGLEDFYIYAE
ncbi:MAG: LTA synthase family protein, partial [Eubacteriales bacterium]